MKVYQILLSVYLISLGLSSKTTAQVLDIEIVNCRVTKADMEMIKKIARFEKDLYNNLFNNKSNDSLLIKVKVMGAADYKQISKNAVALHKTWGFYDPYLDECVVLRNSRYLQTVIHEMSHCLLRHNLNNPPRWLNEGIAEFCGSMLVDNDQVSYAPDAHKIKIVRDMVQQSPIKLKQIMNLPNSEWSDLNRRSTLYSISYSVVYFLIKKNPSLLKRILLMMKEGQTAVDAIEYTYGGFSKFEHEYNEFYRATLIKPI